MRNQRPKTDKALEAWNQRVAEYAKTYAGTKFAKNLDIAQKRLAELPKMRSEVDASTTDNQKVMETMVSAVAGLLNVVDAIDDMTENGRIIHQATAMVALMRRKEYAAQGRGWGVIGFGSGQFVPQMYQAFMRTQNLADAYATIFNRSASQAQIDFVNNAINPQTRDTMPRCGRPRRSRRTKATPATCRSRTGWTPRANISTVSSAPKIAF